MRDEGKRMLKRIANVASQFLSRIFNRVHFIGFTQSEFIDLSRSMPSARLPESILHNCSIGIQKNAQFLAGYVCYTQAKNEKIEIIITYRKRRVLNNMSPVGTSGIDLYKVENGKYIWRTCIVPKRKNGMYVKTTIRDLKCSDMLAVFWPSYAQVEHVYVKKSDVDLIDNYSDYRGTVAVYGSSITQGCAASRSGLSYGNLLRTKYGYQVFNYGFSESAKGEIEILDYISHQNADVVILEYDHNASIQELEKTHERAYRIIRNVNPCAYIIMISRISGGVSVSDDEEQVRSNIIEKTYRKALEDGDDRVSFIRGKNLVSEKSEMYLADDRHPNDIGMQLIADAIYNEMQRLGV